MESIADYFTKTFNVSLLPTHKFTDPVKAA